MSEAFHDRDVPFEEDLLRNPYFLKGWLRYIEFNANAPRNHRFSLYERALHALPGSYKLWVRYLKERVVSVGHLAPLDPRRDDVVRVFQRALVFMNKMPVIWEMFLDLIVVQPKITFTRRTFDECLRSLPVTQHHRIWPRYVEFVKKYPLIPDTALRVFRRHLQLEPDGAEAYIEYLLTLGRVDDAAVKLAELVNKDSFRSKHGKTQHDLWVELCTLISANPDKIVSLNVEAIIRAGIRRFTDMVGTLWNALASYYIRLGNTEKARDVFEEAVQTVMTVRDFTQVFDSYAQFEESSIGIALERAGDSPDQLALLELNMARFEFLMDRRPLLLSSVMLRQNPNDVEEWLKRVTLFAGKPKRMIKTFAEAVHTIQPEKATGKFHKLWLAFARLYDDNGDAEQARAIFNRAVQVPFRAVDELANVYAEWAEMEVRRKQFDRAKMVLQQGTAIPRTPMADFQDSKVPVQLRVHRSLKLWVFYADLEESTGTFESTRSIYQHILELRIATPQVVLNYAALLEEKNYFEEAFTVFERGISLFKWPIVYELWNAYLVKFTKRFGGMKLERTRELFEQAVAGCDPKYAKRLYLLYATFEEEHGLARHAMHIYERAAAAVPRKEKYEVWQLYIGRAATVFGVTYTRELYEKAIEALPDAQARDIALEYASLERKLGEIDRARAVYSYASQFCDPRITEASFWRVWNDFEVNHGNEDTYREMLRIKRSVTASFSAGVNFAAAAMAGMVTSGPRLTGPGAGAGAGAGAAGGNSMAALEAEATERAKAGMVKGFVKAGGAQAAAAGSASNRDEISLDDDDNDDKESSSSDDDGDGAADSSAAGGAASEADGAAASEKAMAKGGVAARPVPAEVFGGITEEALGARARFRAKKT